MFKKLTSSILLLVILAGIASCGSEKTPSTTDTLSTESPEVTTQVETGPVASYLPKVDLEGYTLRFATYSNDNGKFWYVEEADGDLVNDAVYKASSLVCEKYNANISIQTYGANYTEVRNFVTKSVQSGEDAFDIVNGHDCTMWSLSLDGIFKNVRELKYQDFSQPWYPQFANDQYQVNNKQYIFTSYMSYQSLAWTKVILINKSIADDFKLEVPYDTVRAGEWTLDKMLTMSASVYKDLNGDNQKDSGDLYGFIGYKKLYGFQSSFVNCYAKDKDGKVTLDYNKERFIDVVSKLNKLFNEEGGYLIGDEPSTKMFINGQGLFYYDGLSILTSTDMRASDINYGILPVPKYDTNQENYLSPALDCQFAIPATATQLDNISLLIEALSSVGYNMVRDVYFETALSTKYTRDDDSIDMLKIIGDSMIVDLAYLNTSAGINGLGRAFMYCLSNPSAGVASYLESIQNSELAIIEKINNFFSN
jgi:hypothetical protein